MARVSLSERADDVCFRANGMDASVESVEPGAESNVLVRGSDT